MRVVQSDALDASPGARAAGTSILGSDGGALRTGGATGLAGGITSTGEAGSVAAGDPTGTGAAGSKVDAGGSMAGATAGEPAAGPNADVVFTMPLVAGVPGPEPMGGSLEIGASLGRGRGVGN